MSLRIGILGAGPHVRQSVLPAFRAQGWEVGALCSIDQDLPEQAARLGIPVATADYRALVEREDLDAVAIATPTPTHHEIMLAAVAAGKHVLCEKPIAMNLQEARDMQAAAQAAGVTAKIDFEFRFSPTRLHVQQLLADGYVGDLRHANIELLTESALIGPELSLSWHDQAALGGGTLNEHGSHYIDMLRQWFGEISDVSARMHTFVGERRDPESGATVQADADDFWTCTMTLAGGGLVTLTQSWVSGISHGLRVAIAGTVGALVVTEKDTMLSDSPVRGGKTGAAQLDEIPRPASLPPLADAPTWRVTVVQRLIREFERGIRDGMSPAPRLLDGLRFQAILDAVRESARAGRRVAVPSADTGDPVARTQARHALGDRDHDAGDRVAAIGARFTRCVRGCVRGCVRRPPMFRQAAPSANHLALVPAPAELAAGTDRRRPHIDRDAAGPQLREILLDQPDMAVVEAGGDSSLARQRQRGPPYLIAEEVPIFCQTISPWPVSATRWKAPGVSESAGIRPALGSSGEM